MSALRSLVLVAALPFAVAACSPGTPFTEDFTEGSGKRGGNAIVNGQETSDYTSTGVFLYQGSFSCSGTLIAPRKVLTAAHCLDNINAADLTFGFGDSENQLTEEIPVVSGVQHPQWDQNTNDIAVVTLGQDASEAPIPLNPLMDDTWIGRSVTLVGYGVSDGPSQSGGGIKRMTDVTISELTAGELKYQTQNGQTACNGDSGGPAYIEENGQRIVVGVTSWGDQNCQQFGVYTRVDTYLDFINQELQNAGCDPNVDPNCGNNQNCDPNVDPNCQQGCDPNDPNCQQGCDPNDPWCQQGCDPNDPNCQGGCDPNDPWCQGSQGGGCGNETYEGRCDGNMVIYCEDDQVYTEMCPGACDFDQQEGYYACM